MVDLFTGRNAVFLILAQLALFAWLFSGLLLELRRGGRRSRAGFRQFHRGAQARSPAGSSASHGDFAEPDAPPPGARSSNRGSTTFEIWLDRAAGEECARILDGPFRGRKLEGLSRTDCFRLHEYCRFNDPAGAQWLEGYIHRRFTGGGRAKSQERDAHQSQTRRPMPADGPMTRQEAFRVLGLSEEAGAKDIARAHRALIKKHHPDRGGSHAQAALINQAKDMLTDRPR